MEPEVQGATPNPQPATGTQPQQSQITPGATPTNPISLDTAAQIKALQDEVDSLKARKTELNAENKAHRLRAEALQSVADLLTSLNIKPEDLKARLETGDAAATRLADRERADANAKIATTLKLTPNALYQSLLKGVEMRVEGEGDAAKVLVKGADGKEVVFDEYAKTRPELLEAIPLLQTKEGAQQAQQNAQNGAQSQNGGSGASGGAWVQQGIGDQPVKLNTEEAARRSQSSLYRGGA